MLAPKHITKYWNGKRSFFGAVLLLWILAGCTSLAPKPEQLQLPAEKPLRRETSISEALAKLGIQTRIYGADLLKIQCREVDDVTGTAKHTGGEIPKSITVMVKSALNAIGGKVVYIPFWPDYYAGLQVAGYPQSEQKLVPDVILAGGITEFDRGLTTVDRSRDFDMETEDIRDPSSVLKGRTLGLDYSQGDKWNKAKIAIDFNLISYQAMCGIPKMQSSNGITVYKGIKERELAFTLFGPTIGLRGSVKKVQGRHDAVRLLVQFSVIQLVGRYLDLPYWQLLDGAQPDPVVVETLKTNFQTRDREGQALMMKRLLWIHGHTVSINGQWDADIQEALAKVDPEHIGLSPSSTVDTYLKLYMSVPLTPESVQKAQEFDQKWAQALAIEKQRALKEKEAQRALQEKENKAKGSMPSKKAPLPKGKPQKQKPPKSDIIIITPLDTQTHTMLKSIVQKIEVKRKKPQVKKGKGTPFQSIRHERPKVGSAPSSEPVR